MLLRFIAVPVVFRVSLALAAFARTQRRLNPIAARRPFG